MLKKNREPKKIEPTKRREPEVIPETPETPGPVLMVRSASDAKGGPTEANVHPSEVENWETAGWKIK